MMMIGLRLAPRAAGPPKIYYWEFKIVVVRPENDNCAARFI